MRVQENIRLRIVLLLCLSVCVASSPSAQDILNDTPPRPAIEAFEIDGVHSVDEAELRAALQTRASPWLPWQDRVRLDPTVLEADVQRAKEFYAARGFPGAAVTSTVEPVEDDKVRVRLIVEEGEPVRLHGFLFEGFEGIVPAPVLSALAAQAPLQPGEPLARAPLMATAQLALDLVRDAGHARAKVSLFETAVSPRDVQVTLQADPGPVAFFGRIDIAGNQRVDDPVIRRYVQFRPGERFSLQPIRETRHRLAALGLFKTVEIEVVNPEAQTPEVPILIRVSERDQQEYEISFGYGTEEQISGEAEWRHLNVFGGARRLSVLGRWSWIDRVLQADFVEPYLFHPDLSLGLRGQVSSVDHSFFDVLSAGGAASLTYRQSAANVISTTYLQQYQRTRLSDLALADPELRARLGANGAGTPTGVEDGLLAAVQLDVIRDTRDIPADPRRGYRVGARLERAGGWLPGTFDFYTAITDARHFLPLGPMTLAHRAQYGSVAPAGAAADVPIFRRFFLGGSESLRGWGRFEVSPLSPAGQPVGGRAFLAATSELRLPIGAGVGAAVFVDAGNVWRDAWTLRLTDLRYSAGAGMRYDSPFGAMRVDLGYQLTPIDGLRVEGEPRDRRWRVHFTFGRGF